MAHWFRLQVATFTLAAFRLIAHNCAANPGNWSHLLQSGAVNSLRSLPRKSKEVGSSRRPARRPLPPTAYRDSKVPDSGQSKLPASGL